MTSGDIAVGYFMKYLQVITPLNCPTQHSFTTTCNTNDEIILTAVVLATQTEGGKTTIFVI